MNAWKEKFKDAAEIVNDFRVWPRLLISMYGYLVYEVTLWYMTLPDPSAPQSSFLALIWGASAAWFGLYVKSGNNEK